MARALELAIRGRGLVEPNPMVGCVIVRGEQIIGEGWHPRFGQAHAEIEALRAAGTAARGADLFVTLEPCCHHGKTPPCTDAICMAGVRRVVMAHRDPFPAVAGQGAKKLVAAGIHVECGLMADECAELNAPFIRRVAFGRPWVLAKWAMTWDGRIASRRKDSQWISSEASRAVVHALRGRVDAILVGRGTAVADDPLLTARPRGPRSALRIVLDSRGVLGDSRLLHTAAEAPVLIAVGPDAEETDLQRLRAAGCQVWVGSSADPAPRCQELLAELAHRGITNLLVEGGAQVLGVFNDLDYIDEVHVFVAPKLIGGQEALSPLGGRGLGTMAEARRLTRLTFERIGDDMYVQGRSERALAEIRTAAGV